MVPSSKHSKPSHGATTVFLVWVNFFLQKKKKKYTAKPKVSLITNIFLLAEFTRTLKIVEL